VCVFDTEAGVKGENGAVHKNSVGKMEWPQLTEKAVSDPKFLKQASADAGVSSPDELRQIMGILKDTPVHAEPHTPDPDLAAKAMGVRELLNKFYSANDLYTGMGATMNTSGDLGAREVMVENGGTKFKLTPDNHKIVPIGKLTQADVDALK
jgi:hypothetical protein